MVYMYHSFLIHSSADGHLGCFHVLAIINSSTLFLFSLTLKYSLVSLVIFVFDPFKTVLFDLQISVNFQNFPFWYYTTVIMASDPITSWQIEGKKGKQWQILFSWATKITADSDCNHEIKRSLFLRRKAMINLEWSESHSVVSNSLQPYGL